jgi:hypothetical protein
MVVRCKLGKDVSVERRRELWRMIWALRVKFK